MESKLLTILGLGLTLSLNLNAQNAKEDDSTKFYNNKGQLEKVIIKNKNGEEKISYKYNENGLLIERIFDANWKKEEYHSKIEYLYDSKGNILKKIFKYDTDGDGIYEELQECTCGGNKKAI